MASDFGVMLLKNMNKIIFILIASLYFYTAHASQEGMLSFSEFQIKSNGIGKSGSITVNGYKNKQGEFSSISVNAFGKIINVPKNIMSQIPSKNQNGIQLSYEHGYKKLSGKIIYLQFQVGFTSGIRQLFIIAVSENGNVKVIPR